VISSEALILIAGVVTSLATIALNAIIARQSNFDFLSISVWFILPVGAMIGGMAAASGYYYAAILTDTMPSRTFLFEMVGIAVSTWVLGIWVDYALATFSDGTAVSSQASLWEFFKFQAEHTQLTMNTHGASGESFGALGGWGYVREVGQLLGFMLGGVFVWAYLSDREVCAGCRKYAKVESLLTAQSPDRFQDVLHQSNVVLPDLVEDAKKLMGGSPFVGLDLRLLRCPKCHTEWARPAVVVQSGKNNESRKLAMYSVSAEQATALRRAAKTAA
jgi:hypothetical protein